MSFPAGAAVAKKRRRIIQAFRDSAAISPEKALPLGVLGIPDHMLVKIQKWRGVIVEVEGNRYYLDETREREVAKQRRKLAITLLIIIIIAMVIIGRICNPATP